MSSFTSQTELPLSGRQLNCAYSSLELLQYIHVQTIAGAWALDLALDDSGGLEHFQMLADGGLGQGQDLDDLTADAVVDGFQMFDDPDPGRMPQGFADTGKDVGVKERFTVRIHL